MIVFAVERLDDGRFVAKKFKENSIKLELETEYQLGFFIHAETAIDELDNKCKGITSDREFLLIE